MSQLRATNSTRSPCPPKCKLKRSSTVSVPKSLELTMKQRGMATWWLKMLIGGTHGSVPSRLMIHSSTKALTVKIASTKTFNQVSLVEVMLKRSKLSLINWIQRLRSVLMLIGRLKLHWPNHRMLTLTQLPTVCDSMSSTQNRSISNRQIMTIIFLFPKLMQYQKKMIMWQIHRSQRVLEPLRISNKDKEWWSPMLRTTTQRREQQTFCRVSIRRPTLNGQKALPSWPRCFKLAWLAERQRLQSKQCLPVTTLKLVLQVWITTGAAKNPNHVLLI